MRKQRNKNISRKLVGIPMLSVIHITQLAI